MRLLEALMNKRSDELDDEEKKTGKKQTGGMFDVIYRAKKKRDALNEEMMNLDSDHTASSAIRG